MRPLNPDPFFENLEKKGKDQVEVDLAAKRYDERKTRLAELWLERKEREEAEASRSEDAETAKRAANAAERAADAADRAADAAEAANTRATIALIATAVIAAASIIGLFLSWSSSG